MTADSASFAEIETTDAAPAADLPVADVSVVADLSIPAANDPVSDAAASEAPKAFADDTKPVDAFNDTAGNDDTFDSKSKRFALDKMAGDSTIGEAGGGPMNQPSAQDRDEKRKEDLDDLIDQIMEQHAEQQRQEEHARKWDNEMHDFGGEQLTGEEINNIYKWFAKKENQDKVREQMKKAGKTDKEIDDTFTKMLEREKLYEKMRLGTATQEEKDKYKALGTPDVIQGEAVTRSASEIDRKAEQTQKAQLSNKASNAEFDNMWAKNTLIKVGSVAPPDSKASFDQDTKATLGKVETSLTTNQNPGYEHFKTAVNIGKQFDVAATGVAAAEAPIATNKVAPKPLAVVAAADIANVI